MECHVCHRHRIPGCSVRELARLQLSITGITEARLTGAGTRCIENALILHSGGDTHINGVALVVLPPFVRALVSWKPISDRLLTARFAHKHGHFSVIVCYAPTEPSDDTAKENFYTVVQKKRANFGGL